MGRIRTVKPELFQHELLFEAEKETGFPMRLAFVGIFCQCDRRGRFKWRPLRLKLGVLPYDEIDFSRVMDALLTRGFLMKYEVEGENYGWIPTFLDHQVINNRESESVLPEPPEDQVIESKKRRVNDASVTRHGEDKGEWKGREGNMEGNNKKCSADASPKKGESGSGNPPPKKNPPLSGRSPLKSFPQPGGSGKNELSLDVWNENVRFTVCTQIGDSKKDLFADYVIRQNAGKIELPPTIIKSLLNTARKLLNSIGTKPPSKQEFTSISFEESGGVKVTDLELKTLTDGCCNELKCSIKFAINQLEILVGNVEVVVLIANNTLFSTLTASFPAKMEESMSREICKSFAPTVTNAKPTTSRTGNPDFTKAEKALLNCGCQFGDFFIEPWKVLCTSKKWRGKETTAIEMSLKQLMEFDELFAIDLVKKAIGGNYQGVVFPDTKQKFANWKNQNNGGKPTGTVITGEREYGNL